MKLSRQHADVISHHYRDKVIIVAVVHTRTYDAACSRMPYIFNTYTYTSILNGLNDNKNE